MNTGKSQTKQPRYWGRTTSSRLRPRYYEVSIVHSYFFTSLFQYDKRKMNTLIFSLLVWDNFHIPNFFILSAFCPFLFSR